MSGSNILIIAGEASGDLHASGLIRELLKKRPQLKISCVGGERMESAGASVIVPSRQLSVVGLLEVFSHAGPLCSAFFKIRRWIREKRPDLLVLVDFPEFNLLMAQYAKTFDIPVFYFISPQVWAWRQGRVKKIRRLVDKMAVILPFEEEFYKRFGIDATFVGHPLLDSIDVDSIQDERLRRRLGLDKNNPLICLLPGSRKGEIERHLPIMLESALLLKKKIGELRFLVAANQGTLPLVSSIIDAASYPVSDYIHIVEGETYEAIKASHLCMAASGTVTLETAIIGTPMIVMYKVSTISYLAGKRLIKVPWVSLVNLIANKEVVPELLQDEASPENLANCSYHILNDSSKQKMMKDGFKKVVQSLGSGGVPARTADLVLELLDQKVVSHF